MENMGSSAPTTGGGPTTKEGWTCAADGLPMNLHECIRAAKARLREARLREARLREARGAVPGAGQVLRGVVLPDPELRPFGRVGPLGGPFGPKTAALIAELTAPREPPCDAAHKPPEVISSLTISVVDDPNDTATIEFLDHKATVALRPCEMPPVVPGGPPSVELGISESDLMDFLSAELGVNSAVMRTNARIGGVGKAWANLLVMPGLFAKGVSLRNNKIRKRKTTVTLKRVRRCDMCGQVPNKGNARSPKVDMPGGGKVELYLCLERHCPSGTLVVGGHTGPAFSPSDAAGLSGTRT